MNFLTGLLMCIPLYAAFRAFIITRDPEAKKRIPKTTLKALTFFAYFTFIVLGFFVITEGIEYLSQL